VDLGIGPLEISQEVLPALCASIQGVRGLGLARRGQAAQELRLRTGEVVGDAEESQEIFDSASFVLPDLIEGRSTRSQRVA